MEVYSTAAFRRDKAANWSSLNRHVFAPLAFDVPRDQDFEAELRMVAVGPLLLSRAHAEPAHIVRRAEHVSGTQDQHFFLNIVLRGEALFSQYGRQARLGVGDFAMGDSTAPAEMTFGKPVQFLGLRVPADMLRAQTPFPEQLCGRAMPGRHGFGHTVTQMLTSVWDQMEGAVPEEFGPTVARHLVDVLSTSFAMAQRTVVNESAVTRARQVEVKRFVEAHLHVPELGPAMVAAAFRISPRYLRMLFAEEAESVSKYILRRRLEECARQLTSAAWRGHTITEIAFNWGFNNTAHFTRVFREHFGLTPRDYRHAHSTP